MPRDVEVVGGDVAAELQEIRARYQADGFCKLPRLVPEHRVPDVIEHMDLVLEGSYETGRPPFNRRPPLDDTGPAGLIKVDQAHRCDEVIRAAVTSPEIGRWAAAVTGADVVQVFAVQLLHKPATTDPTGSVGWHQDEHYWRTWFEGEAFTVWLAMSEVTERSGPVCFIRGSHRWGYVQGGDFYRKDLTATREGLTVPDGAIWDEVSVPLQPGEATMHQRLTIHGSHPNLESWPRRSFAIHMRTDRAVRIGDHPPFTDEDDHDECPIIWDHGAAS